MNPVPKPKNYCKCGCGTEISITRKWVSGHNLKRRPKDAIVKNGRTYKIIKCSECGKKFERRSDQINRRGLNNYCSKECIGKANGRKSKGRILHSARKGDYRNCKQCNKQFYINPYRSKQKGNGQFCSRECHSEFVRIEGIVPEKFIASVNNAGKNNPMYKHGKRVGTHVGKKKIREKVIERDGGNWCLFCGKPGPGLHLHRIIYGSQGGRYEVDNCVQLCPEHHQLVHSSKKKWMPKLLEHVENKRKWAEGNWEHGQGH